MYVLGEEYIPNIPELNYSLDSALSPYFGNLIMMFAI